jgi:hypothetical protein
MFASIFSGLLNSAFSGIASSFAQAANLFMEVLFKLLNSATQLSLNQASFATEFDAVFMVGIIVALGLAMIEVASAALARSGPRMMKIPVNLVVMVVGTVVSITFVDMLLTVSDQLSTGLIAATGFSLKTTGMSAALSMTETQPATEMVVALLIIAATMCCYVALIIRRVLILVAAVLAPLALAGRTAQSTRGWTKRWIETTVALIFSKVILVIILISGFHLLQGTGATNVVAAMGSLFGGIGLLFLAATSPLMAMKMASFTGGHFAEAAALGHGALSSATAPVKKAAAVVSTPATPGVGLAAGAFTGGLGGAVASAKGSMASAPGSGPTATGPTPGPTTDPGPSSPGSSPSGVSDGGTSGAPIAAPAASTPAPGQPAATPYVAPADPPRATPTKDTAYDVRAMAQAKSAQQGASVPAHTVASTTSTGGSGENVPPSSARTADVPLTLASREGRAMYPSVATTRTDAPAAAPTPEPLRPHPSAPDTVSAAARVATSPSPVPSTPSSGGERAVAPPKTSEAFETPPPVGGPS